MQRLVLRYPVQAILDHFSRIHKPFRVSMLLRPRIGGPSSTVLIASINGRDSMKIPRSGDQVAEERCLIAQAPGDQVHDLAVALQRAVHGEQA